MLEKLLALFFAFGILGQVWILRLHTGTLLAPGCLYGLFWFSYTAIPLLASPSAPVNPLAIAYIFLSSLIFSAPAIAIRWKSLILLNQSYQPKFYLNSPVVKRFFLLFACLAVLSTIINWGLQGVSYYDIFFNLLEVSGNYMGKRYSGDLQVSIASQMSIVFTYPTAILGGILYGSRLDGDNGLRYIVISITSAFLMMIVEAAKGSLFLVLVLFWSGTLLAKINHGDTSSMFESINKVRFAILVLVIFVITSFSFVARGIDVDIGLLETLSTLHYYFLSYSSGHLYAFSDWFTSVTTGGARLSYTSINNSNGFYTFMSLFNIVGTSKVAPPGVYEEYFYFGDGLQTNIYTHYRGLILDFSLVGSLVFMFIFGALCHLVFFYLLRGKSPWLAASLFVHIPAYIYTSFIISILIWNSVYASVIIVAIVLSINYYAYSTSGKFLLKWGNRRV